MAEKKKGLTKAAQKAEAPSQTPASELVAYSEREPEKVVPAEGSDGYATPSGYALAKGLEGEEYAREKAKKRWGY